MANEGINIAIEEFQELTSIKVNEYLLQINQFFITDFPKIKNWYKGETDKPSAESFKNLFVLLTKSANILTTFASRRDEFVLRFYHFELLENLENVNTKLLWTLNLSKFLRSTRTRNSYKSKIELDYVMKKHETLETVQAEQIGLSGFDNDWWELAMRNDLSEEDYDTKGGQALVLPVNFEAGIFLTSVVDNPVGDKMYGRDIKRKLTWKDNDLETLNYNDTVNQSVDIMLETRLGTIPERPKLGYNESLVTGNTQGTVSLPILQRQLLNIFNTDDSLSSFKISRIEFEQDALFLDFEINTTRGVALSKTAKIG